MTLMIHPGRVVSQFRTRRKEGKLTLQSDRARNIMAIESFAKRTEARCHLLRGSDEPVVLTLDEAALIRRLWTGGHSRAHAAKSPTPQALLLRPVRGKPLRDRHKQRQTVAKQPTLMSCIRTLLKAYAILWQKLYARFSEHAFDQGNRVLVSRVSTHLDIRDRVSMKTGRLSQVPNRQIERSTRHPNLCACQQTRNAKQSNQGGSKRTSNYLNLSQRADRKNQTAGNSSVARTRGPL
jgi:hypothetical protein